MFLFESSGHPDYLHIGEQVSKALGADDEDGVRQSDVVVIGQGNVALDCARILAKGKHGLYDTGEWCRVVRALFIESIRKWLSRDALANTSLSFAPRQTLLVARYLSWVTESLA
jgi:hypothetical protein